MAGNDKPDESRLVIGRLQAMVVAESVWLMEGVGRRPQSGPALAGGALSIVAERVNGR